MSAPPPREREKAAAAGDGFSVLLGRLDLFRGVVQAREVVQQAQGDQCAVARRMGYVTAVGKKQGS
jgi:hypothetical protein